LVHLPSLYFLLEDKAPTRVNNARVSASIPEESTNTDSSCCFFRLILCSFFIRKVQVLTSTDSGSCFVGSSDRSALIIAIKLMITSKGTVPDNKLLFSPVIKTSSSGEVLSISRRALMKKLPSHSSSSPSYSMSSIPLACSSFSWSFLSIARVARGKRQSVVICYVPQSSLKICYFPPKIHSP
jgi:hypothetical protein